MLPDVSPCVLGWRDVAEECSRRLRLLVAHSPAVLPGGESTNVAGEARVSRIWLTRAPAMGCPPSRAS